VAPDDTRELCQAVADSEAPGGRGWSPPGGDDAMIILQGLGAWRCVMPARRSGA